MFNLIRQFVQLQDDSSAAAASAPGEEAEPEHYLYFRGIPMPPDDYVAPAGASPNTWPAIYNNLQNMDYCTSTFSHLGNRRVADTEAQAFAA